LLRDLQDAIHITRLRDTAEFLRGRPRSTTVTSTMIATGMMTGDSAKMTAIVFTLTIAAMPIIGEVANGLCLCEDKLSQVAIMYVQCPSLTGREHHLPLPDINMATMMVMLSLTTRRRESSQT
jgi:hypothetical protein